jgi:hypothetical protein
MAIEVAKYQFHSWARKGISAQIKEQDTLGNPAVTPPAGERASVPLGVSLNGTPETPKDFALVGAADIIGVHRDMIVRTEPRNAIPNFEANYLAFIEFYDEDFPWRYTPAKADGERLRPWIFLLVLKDDEFKRDDGLLPLPVIRIKTKEAFPASDETWLFAHAHTEQEIPAGELSNLEKYLKSLQEMVTTDPDKIYSRLLSPRHLEANQSYHAFLVPAFEVGRLAGLGRPTAGVSAQKPAWDAATTRLEMPFYFDWSFRTGEKVDFESLVELLEPRVLDAKIGIRSMDCSKPDFVRVDGAGLAKPGEDPGLPPPDPVVQGLEGALKTDRTQSVPLNFSANAFQQELQVLINLPETIQVNVNAVPGSDDDFLNDPVVTVPFYGQNHARQHKTDKVLFNPARSGWYDDLNRDPRTRVPAGFGTSVIQKNQEKFMQKAWQQVQKVYEANRKIRQFQFIMQVSLRFTATVFARLGPAQLLAMSRPVHAKVLGSPTTIRQQLNESRLAGPVFSAAFRRLVRPAGKVAQRLSLAGRRWQYSDLVRGINEGRLTAAPPREVPAGIPSVDDLARRIQPRSFPPWLRWLMRHRVWALLMMLTLSVLAGMLASAWAITAVLAVVSVSTFYWLGEQSNRTEAAEMLVEPASAVASIAAVPPQPAFRIVLEEETAAPTVTAAVGSAASEGAGPRTTGSAGPTATGGAAPTTTGGAGSATTGVAPTTTPDVRPAATPPGDANVDSVDARNFRSAALQLHERLAIRIPEKPALPAFNLANGHAKVLNAIHPHVAFPLRLSALVRLPDLSLSRPEEIVDAMAHPDFEDATYTHLRDINKELLIPNLQLIPPNTISLLETNPKFIESYLVGLNHEMGRELLWREYPTDLRGSYFRQFWEVKGVSNPDTPADAEQLKDITKIHTWQSTSPLGAHKPIPGANADVQPGEKQVVLVIRGELLKRYPNTVIYAQKAIDDGKGNNVLRETDLTPTQFEQELKFPLFRAEIDPDLRFFGFDLTIKKAKGTTDSNDFPGDKRGWFFVIQEVPGEPRFGMDIAYAATRDSDTDPTNDPRDTWNNLAWNSFGAAEPDFVTRVPAPVFNRPDAAELSRHPWANNSAQMAYILFQTPVMVAVHATEMLEKTESA